MRRIGKQTISRYFRTNCKRQLYLNLRTDKDLDNEDYPAREVRPAIQATREMGNIWEAEKLADLLQAFGTSRIKSNIKAHSKLVGTQGQKLDEYDVVELDTAFWLNVPDTFIAQGSYKVPSNFKSQRNLDQFEQGSDLLEFTRLRPDLIWLRQPGKYSEYVTTTGEIANLPDNDDRIQIQLIDIKFSSEPSISHYVELVYYAVTLSAWLSEYGFDNAYVVVPNCSVWPGSYNDSELLQLSRLKQSSSLTPSIDELNEALEKDLEEVPFEPILQRLNTFFERDLIEVLRADVTNWTNLSWHVDLNCSNCEFLGISQDIVSPKHPNYCHVEASQNDKITRIPFLGRGAKLELEGNAIDTTSKLRTLPKSSPVFVTHNQLRADRNILTSRAEALASDSSVIPNGRQTIAIPKTSQTDLKIFLTLDFDPTSGLTFGFGLSTLWWPPSTVGSPNPKGTRPNKQVNAFIVSGSTPKEELTQLLLVLKAILSEITTVAKALEDAGKTNSAAIPRVQFYIWDNIQAKHIRRVMGRHLADPQIQQFFRQFIWRFPPEHILPDPELEQKAPISVVKPALQQLVGLPLPYDYSLLKAARVFNKAGNNNPAWLYVHPLFESGLGDQIPYERAHEIWTHSGYHNNSNNTTITWSKLVEFLDKAIKAKLSALDNIVEKLEAELSSQSRLLLKPKPVNLEKKPKMLRGISPDGQLWLNYAKLEAIAGEVEVQAIRAMELEEREARYHCAILERKLTGNEELQALQSMGQQPDPNIWVYKMSQSSSEVKLNPLDFTWALAPKDEPGFLDLTVLQLTGHNKDLATQIAGKYLNSRIESYTEVSIIEIDRENLWLAVKPKRPDKCKILEDNSLLDFSGELVLDKVFHEYWTEKLEHCLREIKKPSIAQPASQTQRALGQ